MQKDFYCLISHFLSSLLIQLWLFMVCIRKTLQKLMILHYQLLLYVLELPIYFS